MSIRVPTKPKRQPPVAVVSRQCAGCKSPVDDDSAFAFRDGGDVLAVCKDCCEEMTRKQLYGPGAEW